MSRSKKNLLPTEVSYDTEEFAITCPMEDFVNAIGPLPSGKQGATLGIKGGRFTLPVQLNPKGPKVPVTFELDGVLELSARVVLKAV